MFKEEFRKEYNKKIYNFPINNNLLSNIINNWKMKTNKFTKYSIFDNKYDYMGQLILREYRYIYSPFKKKKNKFNEFIIWCNDENLNRIRKSKNIFIDGTFHHPPGFYQLIIIMYKDIITGYKIPAFYILLTSKEELLYDEIFNSIIKLITDNNKINFKFDTIVSDAEKGLIIII